MRNGKSVFQMREKKQDKPKSVLLFESLCCLAAYEG